jgi:lipoprotein LprG
MHDASPRLRRSRGRALLLGAATTLAAAVLALAACGGSTSTPTAADLLQKAQQKWAATTSLHFILTMQNAGSGSVNNPYPTAAQGDVKRPDELSADSTVDVGIGAFNVKLIIVGSNEWFTNPLTGHYDTTNQFGSFLLVFDPNQGLGALLTKLQNPTKPADGSANGTPCWKISGTLAPSLLQPIFGPITATGPVPTTFCLGKDDDRLYSAIITGNVTTGDKASTVRTFYLSKFDETITITPPPGS